MILFIEQLLIHGAFLFMNAIQGLYEFSAFLFCETNSECKKSSTTSKEIASAEDCIPLWGLPVINNQVDLQQETYTTTFITEEQDNYFSSLIDCFKDTKEQALEEVHDVVQSEFEDSILTMDSWESQTDPVAVTPKLAAIANAKINESLIGEQLWVVEVIGAEQEYIHVSDGSGRAWINAENFGTLGKRDILSILVNRESDLSVELTAVDVLQKHSYDFSLLDDCYNDEFIEYNNHSLTVGA